MEKNGDFNDFKCGTVMGARWAGLSISETSDILGFTCKTSLGFTENGWKKRKHPVNDSSMVVIALLMPEVRE